MELDVVHNSQDFTLEKKHRMKGTKRDGEGRRTQQECDQKR